MSVEPNVKGARDHNDQVGGLTSCVSLQFGRYGRFGRSCCRCLEFAIDDNVSVSNLSTYVVNSKKLEKIKKTQCNKLKKLKLCLIIKSSTLFE